MNISILNMKRFEENERAIDIALPVIAVECEATPPLQNYLDAYEDAVLRFISIGLSANGIAKAMNATESLIEEILSSLEKKKYATKTEGNPWQLKKQEKTIWMERYLKENQITLSLVICLLMLLKKKFSLSFI